MSALVEAMVVVGLWNCLWSDLALIIAGQNRSFKRLLSLLWCFYRFYSVFYVFMIDLMKFWFLFAVYSGLNCCWSFASIIYFFG